MANFKDITGQLVHHRNPQGLVFILSVLLLSLFQPVLSNDIQSVQSYMDILEGKSFPEDLLLKDRLLQDNLVTEDEVVGDKDTNEMTDVLATAGRLFTYSLPSHFVGDSVFNIQVLEAGLDSLPEWLDFDDMVNELVGVPSDEHIGSHHTIEVTATNVSEPAAPHAFTLKVVEDTVHSDRHDKPSIDSSEKTREEAIKCPPGSSVTSASVTVDVNINKLAPKDMASMIKGLASHLGMPDDWLSLVPVGDRPMSDASALVSGSGDVKDVQTPGAFLQWVVGCGNVQGYHMPILQQLESTSGDGSMTQALGHGVIGWHVTNSRPESASRIKRMARDGARARGNRRNRKKNLRRKNKNKEEREESSGFFSPEVEEDTPPTPTDKPHRTRPEKTTGRHSHKTIHPPKPTEIVSEPTSTTPMPTHVVVTTPTPLPEASTKSSTLMEEVATTTTVSTTTPPLPDMDTSTVGRGGPIFISPGETTTSSTTSTTESIPEEEEDTAIRIENPVESISVFVGDILEYKVPGNTFRDVAKGKRNIKLTLLTSDKTSISRDSWISFDNKTKTIYGMPLDYHVGESEYNLMAVNSDGKIAIDTFKVKVLKRPAGEKVNHEFSVTFDLDYDRFMADTQLRLELLNKIAKAYGDSDMSKITVTGIERGSVKLSWTNNTIPTDTCPTEEIRHLISFMLTSNNTMQQSFIDAMHPIQVQTGGIGPKGTCAVGIDNTAVTTSEKPVVEMRRTNDTDKFISTILPVIIIVCMVVLALIIGCCLYRKKRKGKMSDEDNSTFVTKGIPVIFAEELDDKPDPPTKPLIMSKEKPPLPPPEYPKSGSGGSPPSTPGSGHSEPLLDHYPDDSYTRPPPVTGGTGSMGRRLPKTPSQQPGYRQPPPYTHVPP